MAQQTYRQLVNKAILESGTDLEDIGTGSAFTTPDDKMQTRFKTWVADAWKETQLMFSEIDFTTKQASIKVQPRIYVEQDSTDATAPVSSRAISGNSTNVAFVVGEKIDASTADVHLLSGAWASGTAKAYIGLAIAPNATGVTMSGPGDNYALNERLTQITGVTTDAFGRYKGPGRYDLATEVTDLLEARHDTFRINPMDGDAYPAFNQESYNPKLLQYVPWDRWRYNVNGETTPGEPRFFTCAPNGHYEFYPKPDIPYILNFHYEAEPQVLLTETEVLNPAMKEQYEDIIVWQAVMFYADFDRKGDVYMRAKKRRDYYLNLLLRKEMPMVTHAPSRFG